MSNLVLKADNNSNNNLDLYNTCIHQSGAHRVHELFPKPSQLPGEYTAQLLPFRRI